MGNSTKRTAQSELNKKPLPAEIVGERRYPLNEAAVVLGKSLPTLRRWQRERRLTFYRVGKNIFIGERELARILEESIVPARNAA